MKQAIIDIGSNSMRLSLYEINGTEFKILFKEKIMAGLAGYVENGYLTKEGIECAYTGLNKFKDVLKSLEISNTAVFATASLRNIKNTKEAVKIIKENTGYQVDVISGKEEAMFGYSGAMLSLDIKEGVFLDIGGASTEIVLFKNKEIFKSTSIPIGSLKLYKECVKNILPGNGSMKRIEKQLRENMDESIFKKSNSYSKIACVGGTSRAVLKIASKLFSLPESCNSISIEQLKRVIYTLTSSNKATELILRLTPERIHTIIPGLKILEYTADKFSGKEILFSRYGVREGYLCHKIISKITPNHNG